MPIGRITEKAFDKESNFMQLRAPRDTGSPFAILIGLAVTVLLVFLYSVFGTVEVVFENDDFVISRQENVRAISDIEIPDEATEYYLVGNETVVVDEVDDIKSEIMKTLIINLFTFKWQESDHIIVLHTK